MIPVIDTLKPMGEFPVVESPNVKVGDKTLDGALNDKANKASTESELAKFNNMFSYREA